MSQSSGASGAREIDVDADAHASVIITSRITAAIVTTVTSLPFSAPASAATLGVAITHAALAPDGIVSATTTGSASRDRRSSSVSADNWFVPATATTATTVSTVSAAADHAIVAPAPLLVTTAMFVAPAAAHIVIGIGIALASTVTAAPRTATIFVQHVMIPFRLIPGSPRGWRWS